MAGALTAAIAAAFAGSAAPSSDQYFEYTTLLLPGNGTNGAQNNTFLDGSTNNFTITRNGNTTQGTFSPFSQTGWGNYFDGTGDYLSLASNTDFSFGTSAWTMEGWVYASAIDINTVFFSCGSNGAQFGTNASGYLAIAQTGINFDVNSTTSLPLNQWNHVVAVKNSSNSASIFLNGTRIANASNTINYTSSGTAYINYNSNAVGNDFTGYLSNLRIVKGTAVYDPTLTTLTVPTAPLTAISGTSLLTCQSNRFIDTNTQAAAKTITVNGNTSVVAFSPFNPSASWSAATYGGSGYFDGSGDYLSSASNTAFSLGTGSFTIEGWVYTSSTPSDAGFFTNGGAAAGSLGFYFLTGYLRFDIYSGGGFAATTLLPLNQWVHIACVRSGNTVTLYQNGTSVGSSTITDNNTSSLCYVGTKGWDLTKVFNGYISNFRLVKGTAVYTGNFTPPTAPITNAGSTSAASYPSTTNVNTSFASSATSLLLNYTNAGIYDATSKNDLETVGNAQISTAISAKWGSGSIYLDGTNSRFNFSPPNLFILGTAAFTFETWFYPVAAGGSGTIFTCKLSGGRGFYLVWSTGSVLRLLVNAGTNWNVDISSSALTLNTWHHIAVTRSGSTFYLLANGSLANSQGGVSGEICSTVPIVKIGSDDANGSLMTQSYLQDTRFTNGIARYTGAYTVPTAAFPTQ